MTRVGADRRGLNEALVTEANKGFERAACSEPSRGPVQFETYAMGVGALSGAGGFERIVDQYGPIVVGVVAEAEPWR